MKRATIVICAIILCSCGGNHSSKENNSKLSQFLVIDKYLNQSIKPEDILPEILNRDQITIETLTSYCDLNRDMYSIIIQANCALVEGESAKKRNDPKGEFSSVGKLISPAIKATYYGIKIKNNNEEMDTLAVGFSDEKKSLFKNIREMYKKAYWPDFKDEIMNDKKWPKMTAKLNNDNDVKEYCKNINQKVADIFVSGYHFYSLAFILKFKYGSKSFSNLNEYLQNTVTGQHDQEISNAFTNDELKDLLNKIDSYTKAKDFSSESFGKIYNDWNEGKKTDLQSFITKSNERILDYINVICLTKVIPNK